MPSSSGSLVMAIKPKIKIFSLNLHLRTLRAKKYYRNKNYTFFKCFRIKIQNLKLRGYLAL